MLCKEAMWHGPDSTRMLLCPSGCSPAQTGKLPPILPLHPDCRGMLDLCGVARQAWFTVLIRLWQSSTGLPSQCPWTDLITSVAYIFIPLPVLDPLFHHACTLLSLSIYSQINNSAPIAFSQLVSVSMFQERPIWFHVGLARGTGLCKFDLV